MSRTNELVIPKVECRGRNLWFLMIAANASVLGGFSFGYDNIVISAAIAIVG